MNSEQIQIMQDSAKSAEALLKQLANANRLLILCNLVSGEKTVGDLSRMIGLSQSAISQHLAKMKDANLIEYDKRGLQVYYKISSIEVQALLSILHLIYCNKPN